MKVYVLESLCDEDGVADSYVVGVYADNAKAKRVMEREIKKELKRYKEKYDDVKIDHYGAHVAVINEIDFGGEISQELMRLTIYERTIR